MVIRKVTTGPNRMDMEPMCELKAAPEAVIAEASVGTHPPFSRSRAHVAHSPPTDMPTLESTALSAPR